MILISILLRILAIFLMDPFILVPALLSGFFSQSWKQFFSCDRGRWRGRFPDTQFCIHGSGDQPTGSSWSRIVFPSFPRFQYLCRCRVWFAAPLPDCPRLSSTFSAGFHNNLSRIRLKGPCSSTSGRVNVRRPFLNPIFG